MTGARKLLLLGGGGHAAVVAESARAAGWSVAEYLDDDPSTEVASTEVGLVRAGALDDLAGIAETAEPPAIHAAIGDPQWREIWSDRAARLGLDIATIIDPTATVSPSATIDEGVFIAPQAVINARARIGRGSIINTFAIIEHDCDIGDFCHVAPRAVLCGGAAVGPGSLIGAGAIVGPNVTIGCRVTLGAGAVATTDMDDDCVAVGVPARPLKRLSPQARD